MEKDNCVSVYRSHQSVKTHDIVQQGIQILANLHHRGAVGADPNTGDGAGILIQIPHKFLAKKTEELGFTLPDEGEYGVGMLFYLRSQTQDITAKVSASALLKKKDSNSSDGETSHNMWKHAV